MKSNQILVLSRLVVEVLSEHLLGIYILWIQIILYELAVFSNDHTLFASQLAGIYSGSNYKKSKRDIKLKLSLMDLDITLLGPKPYNPEAGCSTSIILKFKK